MSKKVGLVFSEDYYKYNFGSYHPLRPIRLELTYKLMEAYGLLSDPDLTILKPKMASEIDLALVHDRDYVQFVKKYSNVPLEEFYRENPRGKFGLGTMDDPVFNGMFEASSLVAGATIVAAETVMEDNGINMAFNFGGGLHHAAKKKAHGFCIFNDVAVAIQKIRLKYPDLRVMYIDTDAHHGDGVQDIFYDDKDVLTLSLHQDGKTLFPGTGSLEELGKDEGKYSSINFPLYPGTYDEAYLDLFRRQIPKIIKIFKPDVIFTQLGVDTHFADPLTELGLSTSTHEKLYQYLKDYAEKYTHGKWIAVGGGGYLMTVVPRSWTMALAVMLDKKLDDAIPLDWIEYCESAEIHKQIEDEAVPYALRDKNARAERQLMLNPTFSTKIDKWIDNIEDYVDEIVVPNLKKIYD